MSDQLRSLRRDLHPITNTFRAGRLIIVLLFCLFTIPILLGLIVEVLRPHNDAPPAATKTHEQIRRTH